VRQGVVPQTYWSWKDVGSTRNAKQELSQVMGAEAGEDLFITPKPTKLVERMLQIGTESAENDIVLDFFGGSGTTGHAALSANARDNGNRRYILVQLPEPTGDPKRPTIAELTKERLRRAGKKVRAEWETTQAAATQEPELPNAQSANPAPQLPDLGFRVFKLASSNIQAWEPNRERLAETLEASVDHLKTDRTESDILFELLLKLGLDLTVPIESRTIAGQQVHSIGAGTLLVCLSKSLAANQVEPLALGIAAWHKTQAPAGESTIVFRDSAFADDVAKTNLTAILQQHGLDNVRSL
jgi:adenine-specific DNA-methyltransferase